MSCDSNRTCGRRGCCKGCIDRNTCEEVCKVCVPDKEQTAKEDKKK